MGKRLSGSQAMKKAVKKSSKERKAWVLAHPPAVNVARYDQKAIKTILIVGDGDFSFALGLVQHRGSGAGVTATSFDSAVAQSKKYAGVQARVASLKEAGCAVEFGVDARALSKLTEKLETKKFDRIVFNFPHSGEQRVHVNRALMSDFFESAKTKVTPVEGAIHVALRWIPPYSLWGVESLAKEQGLKLFAFRDFDQSLFPGYKHQTTLGDGARTHPQLQGEDGKECKSLSFVADETASADATDSGADSEAADAEAEVALSPAAPTPKRRKKATPTRAPGEMPTSQKRKTTTPALEGRNHSQRRNDRKKAKRNSDKAPDMVAPLFAEHSLT
mmetsp:Transcript_28961/g.97671  ORF Transcript_28961/g.97671 Transcript_28961/m.97671 type:complete len:332 (-) Transcript_28961:30-1025(-)